MKTIVLILVTLLFFPFFAAAQGFSMGFYLQPQMTSISGDISFADINHEYTLKTKPSYGFAFGLQTAYHFSDRAALSLGVTFSSQTQDYEDLSFTAPPDTQTSITYSTNITYFKIPVLFEYTLNSDKKIALSFYGGMYLGFLTSYEINSSYSDVVNGVETYSLNMRASNTTITTRVSSNGTPNLVTTNLTEECYNTFEVGAQIGAGIVYNVSDKFSIPVSINYEFSFSDLVNSDSYWSNGTDKVSFWEFTNANNPGSMKNSMLGFRVGVRMKIGENPTFD